MAMKKYQSVAEYFEDHSGIHLHIMEQIRDLILEEEPNAEPAISYGMPSYKTDKLITGVYAYKNHVSYYPHSGEVLDKFKDHHKEYKHSKGTLQIGIHQEFPKELIRHLIREKIKLNQG